MNDRRLGTWIVTHVPKSDVKGRHVNGVFLAVALTSAKAASKVHLATALPYDELHATLIRRDAAPVNPRSWLPTFECYLGPLEHFGPRPMTPCRRCSGSGHLMVQEGSTYETRQCGNCNGTGALIRRTTP
jgi:hypothetical protein